MLPLGDVVAQLHAAGFTPKEIGELLARTGDGGEDDDAVVKEIMGRWEPSPTEILVNGRSYVVTQRILSGSAICALVGQPKHATIAWRIRRGRETVRSGSLTPDALLPITDGLIIDCVPTGLA